MQAACEIALKEWAAVCQALADGRQVILLRKGGIDEGREGFRIKHREFWLFPTNFHQQADELIESARELVPQAAAQSPPAGLIRIAHYAVVQDVVHVKDKGQLESLRGQHVLADSTVAKRFHYRKPGLFVAAVRVHRLAAPVDIADEPRFAGCRSWIELTRPLPTEGLEPVLDEAEFKRRLDALAVSNFAWPMRNK